MKYVAVVLAALVLVLGSQALGRADAPAGVQRWEYRLVGCVAGPRTLVVDPELDKMANALKALVAEHMSKAGIEVADMEQFRKLLTEAGAAGWELVATDDNLWAFKRPLK